MRASGAVAAARRIIRMDGRIEALGPGWRGRDAWYGDARPADRKVAERGIERGPRRRRELVIDVRSPSEYPADHIPGAVSVPVLSDAERAEVGTLFKSDAAAARRLGAALVGLAPPFVVASDARRLD